MAGALEARDNVLAQGAGNPTTRAKPEAAVVRLPENPVRVGGAARNFSTRLGRRDVVLRGT